MFWFFKKKEKEINLFEDIKSKDYKYDDEIENEVKQELKEKLLKELDKVENTLSKQQMIAIINWVFR